MKRLFAVGIIVGYLGLLGAGLGSHALNYKTNSHPTMYFIVWDMFCGWSAYEERTHVIGQGESGKYYELAPGPWGDYQPFGNLARHHYDPFSMHAAALAQNTLRYSDHEPMRQLFVVQEVWAKKFNLPDELWAQRYPEPKDPHSYFHIRRVLAPDGRFESENPHWFDYQAQMCLSDNPRLQADSTRGRPYFDVRSQAMITNSVSDGLAMNQ